MARIRPEHIVDELSGEFRRALSDAVRETIPDAHFDEYDLFRAFVRAIGRVCNTWERVSDNNVEKPAK